MNLLFFAFLSTSAFSQLGTPILAGQCGKIILKIQNDIFRAEFPKENGRKICTFRRVYGSATEMPAQSAIIHLVPLTCDGKSNGSPGFDRGDVLMNPFLQIVMKNEKGAGVFFALSTESGVSCEFETSNWPQIKRFATKRSI